MRVLIDGHNAIGALRLRAKSHQAVRKELLRHVAAVARRATVFFDAGNAPAGVPAVTREMDVDVRYAKDADAAILAAVRDAPDPARLIVVTNDREVSAKSSQLGAQTLTVHDFFGAPAPDRPVPLPPPPRPMRFKPSDFGLPDDVDLDDPGFD